MIASLHGTLLEKDINGAVVECGGIGFKVAAPTTTVSALPAVGKEVFLHTHLVVREDAFDLYGFSTLQDLQVFKLITTVSGVGAKIGLALLSQFSADRLLLCLSAADAKSLTAATGVGIKLAQRIVLELKDKVGTVSGENDAGLLKAVGNAAAQPVTGEAIEALVALGFHQSDAALAVGRLDPALPCEELIKQALKILSGRG